MLRQIHYKDTTRDLILYSFGNTWTAEFERVAPYVKQVWTSLTFMKYLSWRLNK